MEIGFRRSLRACHLLFMLSRTHFQLASASDSSASPPKPATPIDYLRQHPKKARITTYHESSYHSVDAYRPQQTPVGHYPGHLQHASHHSQVYAAPHHSQQQTAYLPGPTAVNIKTEASSYLPFSTPDYSTPSYTTRETYPRAVAVAAAMLSSHESKHYFPGSNPQQSLDHHMPMSDTGSYTPAFLPFDSDHVSKSEPCLTPPNCYFTPDMSLTPYAGPRRDSDCMYGASETFSMHLSSIDSGPEFPGMYDCPNAAPERQVSTSNVRSPHCPERELSTYKDKMDSRQCEVCRDTAAGFHCGAFVCEACKKFFIRSWKAENNVRYTCTKSGNCPITKDTRTHCQRCRYKKCIELKMEPPNMRPADSPDISVIPCRVCGAQSSGFHFGVLTCEGCKGFFRRTIHERTNHPYSCSKSGNCVINTQTRNNCKSCRFIKCQQVGMSKNGSRIGRQPNAIKQICREEIKDIKSKHQQLQRQHKNTPIEANSFPISPVLTPDESFRLPPNPQQMAAPPPPTAIAEVTSSESIVSEPTRPNFLAEKGWSVPEFRAQVVKAGEMLFNYRGMEVQNEDRIVFNMSFNDVLCRMLKRFHSHAVKVIEYAKHTPYFKRITNDVQTLLIKEVMYPIMLIQLSADYDPVTGDYNYFDFTHDERDIILKYFPKFKTICDHLRLSGQLIKPCNLNDVELSFLCYIEFIRGDISGSSGNLSSQMNSDLFKHLLRRAESVLENYIAKEHPTSCLQGDKLLEIQAQLSRMNAEHQEIVQELCNLVDRNKKMAGGMSTLPEDLYYEIFSVSQKACPAEPTPQWPVEDDAQREADSTTMMPTAYSPYFSEMERQEVSTTNRPSFGADLWLQ